MTARFEGKHMTDSMERSVIKVVIGAVVLGLSMVFTAIASIPR